MICITGKLKCFILIFIVSCSSYNVGPLNKDPQRNIASQKSATCNELVANILNNVKPQKNILPLPSDDLLVEAERLVQEQEIFMERIFHDSSGFENYDDFKRLIDMNAARLGRIVDIVKNEQIDVGMHVPENVRELIAQGGFKNQHQTETSKGAIGTKVRSTAEASQLDKSYESYAEFDDRLKPKYAALHASRDSKLQSDTFAHSYGEDRYVFNLNKLQKRITWNPGDSWKRFFDKYHHDVDVKNRKTKTPNSWDEIYIPWSYRELLIPILYKDSRIGRLGVENNLEKIDPIFRKLAFGSKNKLLAPYIEVQIWGPISLDDVTEFIFHKTEPTGIFLEELLKRKIKILDSRNPIKPAVPWEPITPD